MNDARTDKLLRRYVGLVAFGAAVCLAWVVPHLQAITTFQILLVTAIAAIVGVASGPMIQIRFRAERRNLTPTSGAILLAIAVLPPSWAVLSVLAGVLTAKIVSQKDPLKRIFNVAKDILATTVAAVVAGLAGISPTGTDTVILPPLPRLALGLLFAAIAFAAVEDLVGHTVIAIATRSSWRKAVRRNLDIVTTVRLINLFLALAVALVIAHDPLLIVAMPLTILALQQSTRSRIRQRNDDEAWQRLANATAELNHTDLTKVLRSAVAQAPELFSADAAEIELFDPRDPRLVRVGFDGPKVYAPEWGGKLIETPLEGNEPGRPLGELRLRFRTEVKLEQFEKYKLQTFASALATSIRNAIAYAEIAYAAAHDPLTGLANRRELLTRTDETFAAREDKGVLALLLIDLNHFKEVNDTLGHQAGDKVLQEVAARLSASAQPHDLVARLGGDEFAVLLTGLPTPAMAAHRAEAMLASLDRSVEVDGMKLTVEACGGIALASGSGGVTELLRRADVAMYHAKRSGQRTANYTHARDTADVGRLMLGGELRRAVTEHEFVVDFQPIVDLGTGEVVSAEALARWHHPDHGNLTPMRFLETVERSGQLPAFADAVLDQALAAVGTWRDAGFDLPVAVNVSPRSLLDAEFPGAVLARLATHAVPPDRLVLELAETLTISQLEVVERTLTELRDAGVRLALDDFGTGFSSLTVLSRIPVHQLKIERDFVRAVETSSEAAAVVRSTVDLARSLGLTVVAEGVESEPQRLALWELGCVAGQGHLFARPMRAARMLTALQRGTGGQPGVLAASLHDGGSVLRLPRRRSSGAERPALPHLPA